MKKLMIASLLFSNIAFGYSVDCAKVKTIDQNMTSMMRYWIEQNGRRDIESAVLDGCLVLMDKDNTRCSISSKSIELCASFLALGKKNLQ